MNKQLRITHFHRLSLYLLTLIFIISSCLPEEGSDKTSINIIASIENSGARGTGNSFQQNDSIGVFIVPYIKDNPVPDILGEAEFANNLIHINQGNYWLTQNGTFYPWPGTRNIDVYAYHPYNDELPDPRNYIFKISQDQSSIEDYMINDFLYAHKLGISPYASVPLIFSHKMSKININIKSDIKLVKESMERASASLLDIIPECIIDLATGEPTITSGTRTAEIKLYTLTNPATDYDRSFSAIIPPQSVSAYNNLLKINSRGVDYFHSPEEEMIFKQGYSTTFNVEITVEGLIVTSSVANGWDD